MSVYRTVSEIFSVKNGVALKPRVGVVQGHWKWRRSMDHIFFILYDFLLVGYCKHSSMLNHFRVIRRWIIVTLKSSFLPSCSHTILFFPHQTLRQYSDGDPHNGGVECRGVKKSPFSTNISFYLGNHIIQRHSYGMRIGNLSMLSFFSHVLCEL